MQISTGRPHKKTKEREMNQTNYDLLVVGTGPGGATVARETAKNGKKVLLLEWGDKKPITGTKTQTFKNALLPSRGMLITPELLGIVRGITTGGSSIYYYATAFEPPIALFKNHGIDLSKEVEEIKEELPIAPLKDDLFGPMASRIMHSAQDLGYAWNKLNKFIYQERCHPGCHQCNYGCPYGAKWNARMYVEEAQAKGAQLINQAKVKKVILENNQAVGLIYKRLGRTHRVYAEKIVLAAGGIGSPVILRNSGLKEAGYDFFFDPLICVLGTVKDLKGGKEIPMASGVHIDDDEYLMTDMTVPQALYMFFTAQVLRLHKLLAHQHTLQIMVKLKDRLGGKVTDRGGVRKRLSENDRQRLMRGYVRAKDILKNAGARNVFKTWYVAAHPGGTVKIGELVDQNLQTRFKNLYVCDCSVIPEAWGLPPTFSLLALGKRLAKHLGKHL